MDQLVVLQEIYASFSKGGGALKKIDVMAIEGCCSDLVARLLESSIEGKIDEEICRILSEKLQDIYELKRLGDICRRAGLARLAANAYKRALTLCQDPVLSPVLQNNLGQAYAGQGDLARALSCYQKAADVFIREGDRTGLAHVLGNMGSAYRMSGEWSRAIEHAHRSLKIFEEEGDGLGVAQMTGSIGRIYSDMGEGELAARYFERSLADFERLGDKRGAAWILDRLGKIARGREEWDKALGYMHSSISIWEEMGESASLGIVLSDLGSTLLQMGQPSAARGPLERAVVLVPEHSRLNFQKALYSLARVYSSIAVDRLEGKPGDKSEEGLFRQERRREASRLFAQSADRYQDLADTLSRGKKEIRAWAALAMSRSYLARISDETSGPQALLLAEKARAALESSAANFDESKRGTALALQKIIAGMIEAYRLDELADEPQAMSKAISISAEFLQEAAPSWSSREAGGALYQALIRISSSIELQISGSCPDLRWQAAASALIKANEYFRRAERESGEASARMIDRAASILNDPEDKSCQEQITAGNNPWDEKSDGSPSWQKEKAALLAIAGAMMAYNFRNLEKSNEMLAWDESTRTDIKEEKESESITIEPVSEEDHPEESADGPHAEPELPGREGINGGHASGLILADGREEFPWAALSAKQEKGNIERAPAGSASQSSLLLPPEERPSWEKGFIRPEKTTEPYASRDERMGMQSRPAEVLEEGEYGEDTVPSFPEYPGQKYHKPPYIDQAPEAGVEDGGPQLSPAGNDLEMEREFADYPLSPRVLLLLKILVALVLILLLIEAAIYLI